MQVEIGKIYEGKVKGITQYGAFVEIEEGTTGMVHISEIANTYVNDIREHLTENQVVKVKVLGINEAGKISLSIKKAVDNPPRRNDNRNDSRNDNRNFHRNNNGNNGDRNNNGGNNDRRPQRNNSRPNVWEPKKQIPQSEMSFEDMLNKFKQNSEEKMCDLKKNIDNKRRNTSRRSK